ncbi:MAG: OsmC family protein [Silicimonas sp.]|nr:OsmC family protein [Silicimonas sp.]
MTESQSAKDAIQRVIEVFRKRPEAAKSTAAGRCRLEEGLACAYVQDGETANMDMPQVMGGDEAAPTPGFYARAGLAGCVAIGIKQTAILEGLTLESVTVEVETDFDNGAMYGLGEASAAPLETRLAIGIESAEAPGALTALVDKALSRDPWFLALRGAQSVKTETKITAVA